MKRIVWCLAVMLLLSGCAGKNTALEEGIQYRNKLLSGNGCRFSAEVTADYGDRLHTFAMDCETDNTGNLRFSVTDPETISGITGTASDDGGILSFDNTVLHFDLLSDGQLSPVSAPWILIKTLRSGYITAACYEEQMLRLTIDDSYEEDALHLDIWLEDERLCRSDILYDGKRILTVRVHDFVIL